LTIPKGKTPESGWPAIVFVHGYIPSSTYQTTSNYSSYVDYLSRNGFVVFKIDLRGHGESEGVPGGAYYSSDYIIDTLNAHAALQMADFVNPEKIGLWGHSMAGNVVFRSLVAKQDIPAVVIWAGAVYSYSDFQEYRISDNSWRPPADDSERRRRRQGLFEAHGEFDPESSFWKQVVPTNYLDGVTGAVQLNHAVNDSVVNIGYSRGLGEILESTQLEYELNEYQSGGHNITGAAFNQAMQNTVSFFEKHLTE
jgi:dipeptidyl aminopeptidase/acylaminoacyl peptidase